MIKSKLFEIKLLKYGELTMSEEENNNKIKTQIIPAIHNTVSFRTFLKTEDNKPISDEKVKYIFYRTNGEKISEYDRTSDENGMTHITLNISSDVYIEVIYKGNSQYEKKELLSYKTKPTQEEKDLKKGHSYQKKIASEKSGEKKRKRQEKIKEFNEHQKVLEEAQNDNIAIELKNVTLSFKVGKDKIDNIKEYVIRTIKRNKEKKTIFKATDDVSLKIYKGEKVGLIGFNGAGKSTLLKIISGVYTPDEGEVNINGNIAPLLSLGAGFDKNYSGRENIFLNGAILGYNEEFLKSKYDEILEFSELEDFIDLPVKNYSSGMLSKLGFSIATIVEPDILILDEVLGVGDVNFRKKSREKLNSLIESNITVLLVSHSIKEIRSICEKAIWIDKGKVREIGEVNQVCDNYLEAAKNASKDQTKKIKPKRF